MLFINISQLLYFFFYSSTSTHDSALIALNHFDCIVTLFSNIPDSKFVTINKWCHKKKTNGNIRKMNVESE